MRAKKTNFFLKEMVVCRMRCDIKESFGCPSHENKSGENSQTGWETIQFTGESILSNEMGDPKTSSRMKQKMNNEKHKGNWWEEKSRRCDHNEFDGVCPKRRREERLSSLPRDPKDELRFYRVSTKWSKRITNAFTTTWSKSWRRIFPKALGCWN